MISTRRLDRTGSAARLLAHARPLRRPVARRGARDAPRVPHARADHVLPRAPAGRRRPHAVRLGRDRQAVPRRLRRDRHRLGRPLPSQDRREGPRAGRPAPAHDDDLPPSRDRPVRQEAGRAHARGERPVGQLLHQLGQRGQRDRHPVGARVHRQHRGHQPAQRLPRRHAGDDGADRARDLEVQVEPDGRASSTRRPATAIAARSAWSIRAAT